MSGIGRSGQRNQTNSARNFAAESCADVS